MASRMICKFQQNVIYLIKQKQIFNMTFGLKKVSKCRLEEAQSLISNLIKERLGWLSAYFNKSYS